MRGGKKQRSRTSWRGQEAGERDKRFQSRRQDKKEENRSRTKKNEAVVGDAADSDRTAGIELVECSK